MIMSVQTHEHERFRKSDRNSEMGQAIRLLNAQTLNESIGSVNISLTFTS